MAKKHRYVKRLQDARRRVHEVIVRGAKGDKAENERRMNANCGKPEPMDGFGALSVSESANKGRIASCGESPIYFLLKKIARATSDLRSGEKRNYEISQSLDAAFYQVQRFRNYHEFSATALRFESGEDALNAYLKERVSAWGWLKRKLFVPVLRKFAGWLYEDVMRTTPIDDAPSNGGFFAP